MFVCFDVSLFGHTHWVLSIAWTRLERGLQGLYVECWLWNHQVKKIVIDKGFESGTLIIQDAEFDDLTDRKIYHESVWFTYIDRNVLLHICSLLFVFGVFVSGPFCFILIYIHSGYNIAFLLSISIFAPHYDHTTSWFGVHYALHTFS